MLLARPSDLVAPLALPRHHHRGARGCSGSPREAYPPRALSPAIRRVAGMPRAKTTTKQINLTLPCRLLQGCAGMHRHRASDTRLPTPLPHASGDAPGEVRGDAPLLSLPSFRD